MERFGPRPNGFIGAGQLKKGPANDVYQDPRPEHEVPAGAELSGFQLCHRRIMA